MSVAFVSLNKPVSRHKKNLTILCSAWGKQDVAEHGTQMALIKSGTVPSDRTLPTHGSAGHVPLYSGLSPFRVESIWDRVHSGLDHSEFSPIWG
jgi:hypothetical protein